MPNAFHGTDCRSDLFVGFLMWQFKSGLSSIVTPSGLVVATCFTRVQVH